MIINIPIERPLPQLIRHAIPETAVKEFWRVPLQEEGLSVDDPQMFIGDCFGGETEDNAPYSLVDMVEGISIMGVWGWTDTRNNIVHAWVSKDADFNLVVWMLGHELGHCCENIETSPDIPPNEARAELFGWAAKNAYLWAKQLTDDS